MAALVAAAAQPTTGPEKLGGGSVLRGGEVMQRSKACGQSMGDGIGPLRY